MQWRILYLKEFDSWLLAQERGLQDEAYAHLETLIEFGPTLGRPYVDTLKGSSLPNLKELRFEYQRAPIRILFAFDPMQQAVLLLGGNKQGDKRWYKKNMPIAEKRYKEHVKRQRQENKGTRK